MRIKGKLTREDKQLVNTLVRSVNSNAGTEVVVYEDGKLKGHKHYIEYILSKVVSSSTLLESDDVSKFKTITVTDEPGDKWTVKYMIDKTKSGRYFLRRQVRDEEGGVFNDKAVEMTRDDFKELGVPKDITYQDVFELAMKMRKQNRGHGL